MSCDYCKKETNLPCLCCGAPVSWDSAELLLLYRMARHIRNTEDLPAVKWGIQALYLLSTLRKLDPEKYDKEVKEGEV